LEAMEQRNRAAQAKLEKSASLTDYRSLAKAGEQDGESILVWTDAFQTALRENEIVRIPSSAVPYYIDAPVFVPSNRRIEAEEGAVIRLKKDVKTLMLCSEHIADGTHEPIRSEERDCNIAIVGGRWEESLTRRAGYGRTGMNDGERSFYGVSTCMLFNNMCGLTLEGMTFAHTGAFAVQTGDIEDVLIRDIVFEECYADGLHLNGNAENIWVKDVRGQCGDDLVALNAYDWHNSSVDFEPFKTVLCEMLELSASSPYKAMRIQPGLYYYDDGSSVDCALYGLIVKNVRGIRTFKLYYQTPSYRIADEEPERGAPGSGDWLYFEDIAVDLAGPLDGFREYLESDPVRGAFAAFEVGANIGHLSFEDIDLTLHRERFPESYLLCVGPKSCVVDGGKREVFDPYVSCAVGTVRTERIRVNGTQIADAAPFIRTVEFDDINRDGRSSGKGAVGELIQS
ncbi:MAG: hypothetical protein J6Q17_08885, partial [Clostridia bacterium]|nr:hypothetical protein [Clostridia bacterium]